MNHSFDNTTPLAAIDIGTNSFHMIITTVDTNGTIHTLDRVKEMVRLGSGSDGGDMHTLAPDAMERGIRALRRFSEIASKHKAHIIAIATSAVREANNKDEFIERAESEAKIQVQVVTGNEEARLIFKGVCRALPINDKKVLVMDIGGGSTETIVAEDGEPTFIRSVKLGAVRLTKKFFDSEVTTDEQIDECRYYIRAEWAHVLEQIQEHVPFDSVIFTSGTLTTLVEMCLYQRQWYVPDSLNDISVSVVELRKTITAILEAHTLQRRRSLAGMDPKRADIIVAGVLILEQLLEAVTIESVTVSTFALREGIIYDSLEKLQDLSKYHHLSSLRSHSVYQACKRYNVELHHAEHVKKLSLEMFDGLKQYHRFGDRERELLEAAALLHDVGYHISPELHHKHSYYIIKYCVLPGFMNDETNIVALIARYHRKSDPKKKHFEFQTLSEEDKRVVCILAGILRIAESLDRRRHSLVTSIECVPISHTYAQCYLSSNVPKSNLDVEFWVAQERKLLLQETLSVTISFEYKEEVT